MRYVLTSSKLNKNETNTLRMNVCREKQKIFPADVVFFCLLCVRRM